MQTFKHFFLILIILTVLACRQTANKNQSINGDPSKSNTGQLVPINFSDTNYYDLLEAVDTTTVDDWSIKYLVKDDSTKYKDLYISCSKGNIKSIYRAENVLEYRRYFVPEFKAETKTNIYFTHGCATDCSAILVFDKDSTVRFTDYSNVVKYNFELGQILYVTDSSYKNEEEIYELALVEAGKHKIHNLTFHGTCDGYKPACVDNVIFSKNRVTVSVNLRNKIEDTNQSKQTMIVRL